MPIDFFTAPCTAANGNCKIPGVVCKNSTSNLEFGLCDDPPPPTLPAYMDMDLLNKSKWVAKVDNPDAKEIIFKAIDACVPILRPNGEPESRCDGVLINGNKLTFVELKDRGSNGWIRKGRDQLISTYLVFKANYDVTKFVITEAYVCNKQVPLAVTSNLIHIQKVKDETGMLLKVDRKIPV